MPQETADQNDNHSIAYCLLGYLCGYYRYYYPMEFITAFLNNAQNDEDVANGTKLMKRYGISISNPKWGVSRGTFFFDKENKVIYKGLGSVKHLSESVSEELYELSKSRTYSHFVDVLSDMAEKTSIDARQIDILIKLDYFSSFGNQRELFRIRELFDLFKKGSAKKIKRDVVDGTPLESIVLKHATDTTKSGAPSKSYTLLDVAAILREGEAAIREVGMPDLGDLAKVRNFAEAMGYSGYVSGKEADRRKLYVKEIYPLKRKKDGVQFGHSIVTQSIGSGVESRFTVFNRVFNQDPIQKDDVILCKSFERDGAYFTLTGYSHIYE